MSLAIGPRPTTEYGMGQEYAFFCMYTMAPRFYVDPGRPPEEIIAQLRADLATAREKSKRQAKAYRELEQASARHRARYEQTEEEVARLRTALSKKTGALGTAIHALKCCSHEACHCADALDVLETEVAGG